MDKQMLARIIIVVFGVAFLWGGLTLIAQEAPELFAIFIAVIILIGVVSLGYWAAQNSGWF